jgi:dihydropteroate synthase
MNKYFAGLVLDYPLIMGIVNVTPDSFSDGGETFDHETAIKRGLKQIKEGADIVDVGGESSRPGSLPISLEEELRLVLPVIEALANEGIVVSVDTRRANVMREAINVGAQIINDITSLTGDMSSLEVVSASEAFVILMHMSGIPHSMSQKTNYQDVVQDVNKYLGNRIDACVKAGIKKSRICIDPGIGFGKTTKHNFQLLDQLSVFLCHECPVMVGVSRKFGMNKASTRRLNESISLGLLAVEKGIKILRVHDVGETRCALNSWLADRNGLK